ncbi:hypothetical protein [Cryobacterium sp. HLT2-28]|uniref:hypothetical protein n=1 Tax=Cryobacterium sp. HLT2-28 TaxID=1259146 RepID=UPI00141A8A00|nr:hypothetical protein [Cryobacterium sp. HLT2-28]
MTNAEYDNGTEKNGTDKTGTGTPATEKAIEGTDKSTGLTPRQLARDARVRLLRSKAAVLRSEVDAIAANHLDPDTLEELLANAGPEEVLRIEKAEHTISARVAEARAEADAAEAEYEQALLERYDESGA